LARCTIDDRLESMRMLTIRILLGRAGITSNTTDEEFATLRLKKKSVLRL
jgi:hypothetical protein